MNLTRFNLFFPEKRDSSWRTRGVPVRHQRRQQRRPSRRRATPVLSTAPHRSPAGTRSADRCRGRLTRRVSRFIVGALDFRRARPTRCARRTNFGAAGEARHPARQRRRDHTGRSRETADGATTRSASTAPSFYTNLAITAYWAHEDRGRERPRSQLSRPARLLRRPRYTVQDEHLNIGDRFQRSRVNRRNDMHRASAGQSSTRDRAPAQTLRPGVDELSRDDERRLDLRERSARRVSSSEQR